jgi:hypothetical protein
VPVQPPPGTNPGPPTKCTLPPNLQFMCKSKTPPPTTKPKPTHPPPVLYFLNCILSGSKGAWEGPEGIPLGLLEAFNSPECKEFLATGGWFPK